MGRRARRKAEQATLWRAGDPPLRTVDGMLLLFTEEVAELAGVAKSTIRWYNAAAATARRTGQPPLFPAPEPQKVRRTTFKSDGHPVTAPTPVWREDVIVYWLTHRLGPGGKPRDPFVMVVDRGDGGDVVLVRNSVTRTVACVACNLTGPGDSRVTASFDDVDLAAEHLNAHVAAGDLVLGSAWDQLLAERRNVGPFSEAG
jgi:hypothetical protein